MKEDATMPRSEETNQRLREEQREKILDAARKVFARKGIAATMADVATEAGVSQGLAYRYFANKEEIVTSLIEQALQAPAADLQRFREVPGTPGQRLNFLLTKVIESRRHPESFQLLAQMLGSEETPDKLREMLHRRGQALQDVLRQLIIEGQATGEIAADDPDQLVRAILASVEGLTRWATYYPEQYNEHFPDASIFLRMLKP
jgi:AcrR family transcriptional regulator